MSTSSPDQFTIDRAAVDADIARRRSIREKGYARWFAKQFLLLAVFLYAVTWWSRFHDRARPLSAMPTWRVVIVLAVPALTAAFVAWIAGYYGFRPEMLDPDKFSQRVMREMQSLTGPGWLRRTLLTGLGLTLGVGVPIGLAIVLLWKPQDLPGGSRMLAVPTFVGITLLWAMPMAFVIRWMSLRAYRRLVRRAPAPA